MQIEHTALEGVVILNPQRFGDDRGWFSEVWNQRAFSASVNDVNFVQDNHSYSAKVNTLRGLHYQAPPHAQDKLVRCTRGAILDVAVDARRGAKTFGQWVLVELSAENARQLFVPKGFLHGFVTIQPDTEVQYKCSDFYAPESDGSVRWDSLGIDWGLTSAPKVSDKDKAALKFADWQTPFTYGDAP